MASGGHYSLPQNSRTSTSNSVAANNRNRNDTACENESQGPPWLLTANNLSLHTSAAENRLSKKQRNKSKPKVTPITDTSPSTESSPQASGGHKAAQKLTQATKLTFHPKKDADLSENSHSRYSKMPSDIDQDGLDSDESGAEAPRDLRYIVSQRRPKKNIQNGLGPKKLLENLSSSSSKQDNTNKLVSFSKPKPDTGVLVERLMHLRDCIKQVSTIMQNLEKTDSVAARSQLGNMEQMLEQLKSEEQEHLELLQQVLSVRDGTTATSSAAHHNEAAALDSSSSTIEDENQPTISPHQNIRNQEAENDDDDDDDDEDDEEETSVAIEKRNELLQKMVASQKKLVALKEQQTALLNMQKKAESRLAEVKAFHEQFLEAGQTNDDVEWTGLLTVNHNGFQSNSDIERSQNQTTVTPPVSNGNVEWDLAVNHNCPQMSKGNSKLARKEIKKSGSGETVNKSLSSINTTEILNLHSRLRALQEFANNAPPADQRGLNAGDDEATAISDLHRKKLENKLKELQEKKNQMDNLLAELSMHVTSTQVNAPLNDSTQDSTVNTNIEFTNDTEDALAEARQYIESVNSGEKNRKMEELKKKLKQLKILTENIEGSAVEEDTQAQGESVQWRGRYSGNKREKTQGPALKSDNLRRDHTAPGFPARRHYEAEGRANEDGDNAAQAIAPNAGAVAAVTSAIVSPSAPLSLSQEQSIMEEHAEIEAKVGKLLAAKNKLQKLQSLLGAVHQFRQSGEPLPNDIIQFIANLQPGFEGLNDLSPAEGNLNTAEDGSHRNVLNQDVSRLNDVEEQLMRQQRELENLTEERKRLLTMQEQLQVLQQQQFGAVAGKNNEQRSSGEGGSVTKKDRNSSNLLLSGSSGDISRTRIVCEDNLQRSRACSSENIRATKDTNSKAPNLINVSRKYPVKYETPKRMDDPALAFLHDELSQSLALRDELQQQKVVLQELLRQEQNKQMGFSQNQDLRSQSGSSEKSELVEGSSSVMAPDTTVAATWGGSSTQDNLDDEVEEEPLESLEEQDEGSATELNQTEERIQELLQPFIEEQNLPDNETLNRRRNIRQCRVHGYKRGLLNQWRKNFQAPTSKKNEQPSFRQPRPEPEVPAHEDSLEPLANTDGRRRQFAKYFQQQLDQTNSLCQSVLKDQQALSGMLLSCSASNQPMVPGQGTPPDMLRYSSQLFQQQQQLLLSLSHCYHLLNMQQMEIFQLHQFIQQSSESEGIVPQPSPVSTHVANDEFNFRPWCMTPWLSSSSLQNPLNFGPPVTPFCFNPVHPSAPSFPLNTGAPAHVAPTAAQDERGATETLNNQVPPGTRANNFLDNFRSYSRQNLLSGAPTTVPSKSNEHLSATSLSGTVSSTTSQMRSSLSFCAASDVAASRAQRTRDFPSQQFPGSYSLPSISATGRRSTTPSASPQTSNGAGARPRTKRPNLNQEQGNAGTRRTTGCVNLLDLSERTRQNSLSPSINQEFHVPNTNIGPHPIDLSPPTMRPMSNETPSQPENLETLRDSIYMEVTSLISSYEQQPEMLADLLKQLQNIGTASNNQSWKALTTIKELLNQGSDNSNISSGMRRKGDTRNKALASHNLMSLSEFARQRLDSNDIQTNSSVLPNNNVFTRDNVENEAVRLSEHVNESPMDESSSSSTSWPKNSTGAIQKKYSRHLSNSGSHSFNVNEATQDGTSSLDHQVKQAILNLVPFLQNHLMEECSLHLQAQLCCHVMNALQNLPVHQQSLRFFRSQLLQAMQQTLAKYLGRRVRDCEEYMLMELTEVVLKELALHKIMQRKKDDNHRDWPSLDNNTLSTRIENTNPLPTRNTESSTVSRMDFDSPQSNEGRFLGSEGFSENELFNNDKHAVSDHREWVEVTFHKDDGNLHGQVSESSAESSSQRSHIDIQPDRLDVRAAPDGIAAAPHPSAMVLPVSPRLLEEESGYDCDAEGETEPEVEAENDETKNLAEADQSGQLGSLNDRLPQCLRDGAVGAPSNSSHLRNSNMLVVHGAVCEDRHDDHLLNGELVNTEDLGATGGEALSQGQTSAAEGEELTLDDIPTKLETLSPDELRRQIVDEQASNSILQEIVSDGQGIGIVGDKENAKDPGAL